MKPGWEPAGYPFQLRAKDCEVRLLTATWGLSEGAGEEAGKESQGLEILSEHLCQPKVGPQPTPEAEELGTSEGSFPFSPED